MGIEKKIEELEARRGATATAITNPLILQHGLTPPVYECSLHLTQEESFYVVRHVPTGKLTRANSTWSEWAKEYERWVDDNETPLRVQYRAVRVEELWRHGVITPPKHLWSEYGYSE
jgi:hypothetical protein